MYALFPGVDALLRVICSGDPTQTVSCTSIFRLFPAETGHLTLPRLNPAGSRWQNLSLRDGNRVCCLGSAGAIASGLQNNRLESIWLQQPLVRCIDVCFDLRAAHPSCSTWPIRFANSRFTRPTSATTAAARTVRTRDTPTEEADCADTRLRCASTTMGRMRTITNVARNSSMTPRLGLLTVAVCILIVCRLRE
jgi:hypothetical protein